MTTPTQANSPKNFEKIRARVRETDRTRFYVYIAGCSDHSLYTGYTTDPARRIREHNKGVGSRYTRSRRPVELVYLREAGSIGEALRLERRIKSLNKREKLLLCDEYKREEKPSRR